MSETIKDTVSIFGLLQSQLQPIVESMAGETVADFTVAIEREPQGFPGWAGQKLIPTFRWRTESGRTGETITCVKKMREPWMQEARHYDYLHDHDFPAVALYGVAQGPNNEEILFLEFLDRFWPGGSPPAKLRRAVLGLRAWLSALPVTPEYGATLWNNPVAGEADGILGQIWETAARGQIGETLADFCRRNRPALPRLTALSRQLSERVAEMPRALSNGELCPGSPPGSDSLRCFDMHSMGLAPRFTDIINFLAIPDGVHTLWGSPAWTPREEYAAHYAREFARHGGATVSAQTVLEECRVLWEANAFQQEWLLGLCRTGEVPWTADRELGKEQTRTALHSQLEYLLHQAG